jgi:hypothetical protein
MKSYQSTPNRLRRPRAPPALNPAAAAADALKLPLLLPLIPLRLLVPPPSSFLPSRIR